MNIGRIALMAVLGAFTIGCHDYRAPNESTTPDAGITRTYDEPGEDISRSDPLPTPIEDSGIPEPQDVQQPDAGNAEPCEPLEDKLVPCGCDNTGEQTARYDCTTESWIPQGFCDDPLDGTRRVSQEQCDPTEDFPVAYFIEVCEKGNFVKTNECQPEGCPEEPKADIAFIIDRSGSMEDNIRAVRQAVDSFAARFRGNNNYRFALVEIPLGQTRLTGIKMDFARYERLREELRDVHANFGWDEPSYDGLYEVVTNELRLSFRQGAKRYGILFTDEPGQTYRSPAIGQEDINDEIRDSNFTAYIFVSRNLFSDYERIVNDPLNDSARYGRLFPINVPAQQMTDNLAGMFDIIEECIGGAE